MSNYQTNSPKATILIVDDVPDNLRLLMKILAKQGYEVRVAYNVTLALRSLQTALPDLILLDIMMPGIDGYQLCKQLKADERTHDIPVIFLSALDEMKNKVKGFAVGGYDYITKPFQAEEVLARVRTHLALRDMQKQLQQQNLLLQQKVNKRKHAEHELRKTKEALEIANKKLLRLATIDELTQIANRRRFDEYLAQEWQRYTRERFPLSLIFCDIDYFKRYNDTYSHQAGDTCLQQTARAMSETIKRTTDLVARYGGEEFAVILPNTDHDGAMYIAQALQQAVQTLHIPHCQSSVSEYVTVSLGVACTVPDRSCLPEVLVAAADGALYDAKKQGRNRVILKTLCLKGER